MSAKTRSPEDWISFLLTIIDYTDARPNWNAVAADTGVYKSGKFVQQAYNNLRKKHDPLPGSLGSSSTPATPKKNPGSTKKKRAPTVTNQDDDDEERKMKRVKTKQVDSNEEKEVVKVEDSEDELNGDVTIVEDDEDEA